MKKKKISTPMIISIILLVLTFVISMVVTISSKENMDVRSRASGQDPYNSTIPDNCLGGNLLDVPDGCHDYVIERRGDCRWSMMSGVGIEGCGEYIEYAKEKAPITISEYACYYLPSLEGCK